MNVGVTYDDAKEEKKIFGYSWVLS